MAGKKGIFQIGFWFRAAVILAVVAGLCVLGLLLKTKGETAVGAAGGGAIKTPDVDVWVVRPTDMTEIIRLPGSAEAYLQIDLSSELGGTVEEVCVGDGDRVKIGQCVVKLNTDILLASLKEHEAALVLARKNYNRTKDLVAERIKKDQDLDEAEAELQIAKAAVERARVRIQKMAITVPKLKKNGFLAGKSAASIDVIVDEILVEPGEYVAPGGTVAKLIVIDPIKVVVDVPEKDVAYLAPGRKVQLSFDPLGGETFEGEIVRVGYVASSATRTFPCEIRIPNPRHKIRSGMIARVRMTRQHKPNTIAVPLFAVVAREEGRMIFVESDGVVEARKVDFGIFQEQFVEITKGLNAGEHLVVRGQRTLRDGERVNVRTRSHAKMFQALKTLRSETSLAGESEE